MNDVGFGRGLVVCVDQMVDRRGSGWVGGWVGGGKEDVPGEGRAGGGDRGVLHLAWGGWVGGWAGCGILGVWMGGMAGWVKGFWGVSCGTARRQRGKRGGKEEEEEQEEEGWGKGGRRHILCRSVGLLCGLGGGGKGVGEEGGRGGGPWVGGWAWWVRGVGKEARAPVRLKTQT